MYRWLIFLHVLAVFTFLLAHGASAAVSFRLRGERVVARVQVLLELSRGANAVADAALLVLLAAGIAAGFMGNWWGHYWIWTALGLLILISVVMTTLGSGPLTRVRELLQSGESARAKTPSQSSQPAAAVEQQVADLLATTRPVMLTVIGGGGLVLILWLMMFKPF
jgi:hypothetical protein